ncbi:MAG: adenylate kinase [Candidatus Aenigmarchaeota archaeon]|nr:adenylate kinase [Candidatus Aenigmarchaeota archaeon]
MRILLLGPPGSGKGTQAAMLSEKFGIPHISAGDLLREEVAKKSATGRNVEAMMNAGKLIPSEIVTEMVRQRLSKNDCSRGFILDGFPRNTEQREMLGVKFDVAVSLELEDTLAIARLSGRRQCLDCGKIYSGDAAECECGGKLYQRKDDKPAAMRERLKIFHRDTRPLIDFYRKEGTLKTVDASKGVDIVFAAICRSIQ